MLSMIEDHLQRMLSHLLGSGSSEAECHIVTGLVRRNDVDGQVSIGILVKLSHINDKYVQGGILTPRQHEHRQSTK